MSDKAPQNRCMGNTRFGSRCGRVVDAPAVFCYRHDPARAAERKAFASQGAQITNNRARRRKQRRIVPLSLRTGADVLAATERHAGALASGKANAAAIAKANAFARLMSVAINAQKLIELENQIDELRRQLDERDGGADGAE